MGFNSAFKGLTELPNNKLHGNSGKCNLSVTVRKLIKDASHLMYRIVTAEFVQRS